MEPSPLDLDFLRIQEAVRRGWLRREQASEALREPGQTLSPIEQCRRRGWLDASQARRLRECAPETGEPAPGDDPHRVGDVIAGRYEIERIFRGGFGRVFLCRTRDGERAALKTLLRKHLENATVRQMFLDEARRWISLGFHPNLVCAYGMEEHLRLPFIVMECIEDGMTLGDRIEQGSDWRTAVDVGRQVASGLAFAGKVAGLVHQDLKPVNILLTAKGSAKVADFGLARVRGQTKAFSGGTPLYMSPEQWNQRPDIDVRSDLYSFGLILYEVATGALPFEPRTQEQLREAHLRGVVRDPRTIRAEIPADLAAFILRCVAKDPSDRPRHFDEAVALLDRIPGVPPRADEMPALPFGVDAEVNRSRNSLALGRPDEALRAAEAALRLGARHVGARNSKALALVALGRKDEALHLLTDTLRFDPQSALTLVNLSYISRECGRIEEALRWFLEALPFASPLELEGLLPVLLDSDRSAEALKLCDRILEVDPRSVPTLHHKSIALRRMGDVAGSLECSDRALALNPRHAKAWVNRANTLVQSGRFAEAADSAQRSIEIDPLMAGSYLAMAAAHGEMGRTKEALACLSRGLIALPEHPLLLRALQRFSAGV